MADKRISQLIERTDIANNDVLPIVASGATTTNKVTISTIQDWMQDNLDVGVTSVGLSVPSAFSVSGSPVTTSGNITISGAGTTAQYIRGDGSLADFPQSSGGGGASVSYYLNGSVSQGTIGGVAYREMNKTPIFGAGTDITINADGYIASFITDAGDPNLLLIPAGNWNFETYFSASSGGGSPTFYVELYKVSAGGTATLIASNSGTPESISLGTNINPYFSALAVPSTTLALTDRLALRYYVTHSGRTITLHTENGHLCQIITTFTTGLTALNGLTAQVQNFATGTSGTDFNISSASTTHTFNLPDASASNRGVVTTGSQVFGGVKTFANGLSLPSAGGTNQASRFVNIGTIHEGSAGSTQIGFNNSNNIYFGKGLSNGGVIQWTNSAVRYYTLPDADGTIALTSDLGNYIQGSGTADSIPKFTGARTIANSAIRDTTSTVVISKNVSVDNGASQAINLTPASGGTTNRIETTGTLPLSLVTSGASITLAAGGVTPQFTLSSAGLVTLTGALNGTSGSFNGLLSTTAGNGLLVGGSGFAFAPSSTRGSAQIVGSTDRILAFGSNGNQDAYIYNSASVFQVVSTPSVSFAVGGVERFNISASTGAATFSSSVTATGVITANGGNIDGTLGEAILFGNASYPAAQKNRIRSSISAGVTGNLLAFEAGNGTIGSYNNNQLVLRGDGNVGIGTASPSELLDIRGANRDQSSGQFNQVIYSTSSQDELRGGSIGFGGFYTGTSLSTTFGAIKGFKENGFGDNTAGALAFYSRPNGGAMSERMRITSAGNVGIGTASPTTYSLAGRHFEVNDAGGGFAFLHNNTTSVKSFFAANESGGLAALFTFSNHPLTFGTNNTERMRITSGGYLKASSDGTYVSAGNNFHELTSTANQTDLLLIRHKGTDPYGHEIFFSGATPNNSTNWFQYFQDATAARFIVRSNGGLTNYQANDANLSDERTKKEISPLESYWDKFKAIEIVKFKYKDQTHDDFNIGVIAQQVEAVAPEFVDVDGWDKKGNDLDEEDNEIVSEEEPLKSIYTADLYHASIKVLQEAMAKIEKLEIEIDSLKNQIK